MRLPLPFRKENTSAARRERDEQLQKSLIGVLRRLSELLEKAAIRMEAQRLKRQGYAEQGQYLVRIDKPGGK